MIEICPRFKLATGTLAFGSPALRVTVIPAAEGGEPSIELARDEVEELRDACEAFLRGEVLR